MNPYRVVVGLLLLGAALAALAPSEPGGYGSSHLAQSGNDVPGTTWRIVAITRDGSESRVPQKLHAMLHFDTNGNYRALICNEISGIAKYGQDHVALYPQATTLVRCPGKLGIVEDEFNTVAIGTFRWVPESGDVLLVRPGGFALRLVPAEDRTGRVTAEARLERL